MGNSRFWIKVFVLLAFVFISVSSVAQRKKKDFDLVGCVYNEDGQELGGVTVSLLDKDNNRVKSVNTGIKVIGENKKLRFYHGGDFMLDIPRVDSVYVLEFVLDGYKDKIVEFQVKDVKKKEWKRNVPDVYLEPNP